MGTEVKCNIKVCKYQFDGRCTRGKIEIVGDDPIRPDMALCDTLEIMKYAKPE